MAETKGKYWTHKPPTAWTAGSLLTMGSFEVDSDNLGAALTVASDTRALFHLPDKCRIHYAVSSQKLNDTNASATLTLALKVRNKAGTTTKTLIADNAVPNSGAIEELEIGTDDPKFHVLDDGTGDDWEVFVEVGTGAATAGTVGEYLAKVDYSLDVPDQTPS